MGLKMDVADITGSMRLSRLSMGGMRIVMRYSGPRMLLRHPVLAVLRQLDGPRTETGPGALPGRKGARRRGNLGEFGTELICVK
jgi:hypothetical protein